MQLIRRVEVRRFRSLQLAALPTLGDLTSLVGRNSSGKSNLLRALNLFFNGEVEAGKGLDFDRDHYQRKSNKKKVIAITCDFELPPGFTVRSGLGDVAALGKRFSIRRQWELDKRRMPFDTLSVVKDDVVLEDSRQAAERFLELITYRYLPVRGVPAQLLQEESQQIAAAVFKRMKQPQSADDLIAAIGRAAEKMLASSSTSLTNSGAPLTSPSLATAASLVEMLTMKGFTARGVHGGVVRDEDWGAGHQAFFLYSLLRTIDTSYSTDFGWRQATVWAIEEPESTLHHDLATRLAGALRDWSKDRTSKHQIILTTHSPTFVMACDQGYWCQVDGQSSAVEKREIPELTQTAEASGVSGWVHPVLSFPWNPVVLVEGPIDERVLSHVTKLSGYNELRFHCLRGFDATEPGGGKDAIHNYLKRHGGLIPNRPLGAPFLVLYDWDVSAQELDRARKAYGQDGSFFVLRMDPAFAQLRVGAEFKGIERFYPESLLLEAQKEQELLMAIPEDNSKPFSVSKESLEKAKSRLADRILRCQDPSLLAPLVSVVGQVSKAAKTSQATLDLGVA